MVKFELLNVRVVGVDTYHVKVVISQGQFIYFT